jgi:hydroxypyruvate reductase 1
VLDDATRHLINAERLALMKTNAILVNTSRGPVIKEDDLVAHCRTHPDFGPAWMCLKTSLNWPKG